MSSRQLARTRSRRHSLAAVYGVTTRRLNEAVKRNAERFPDVLNSPRAIAMGVCVARPRDAARAPRSPLSIVAQTVTV
ncbi:MAG: ORF6N domain-containing protein [Steroidobacteraceae bacterium]